MDEHLEAEYEERHGMSLQQAQAEDEAPEGEDMETCSLCTTEVPWSELTTTDAGNVCPDCYEEHDFDGSI